jgi:hypothetical protein
MWGDTFLLHPGDESGMSPVGMSPLGIFLVNVSLWGRGVTIWAAISFLERSDIR